MGATGATGATGPTGPSGGHAEATFPSTTGTASVTNPSVIMSHGWDDVPFSVQAGFTWMNQDAATYTGTSTDYFTLDIYDCAPGQHGSGGTHVATWSGQSVSVAPSTSTAFTAVATFPYTLVVGNSFQLVWTDHKPNGVSTPNGRAIGE
jgi:hypothetical protein